MSGEICKQLVHAEDWSGPLRKSRGQVFASSGGQWREGVFAHLVRLGGASSVTWKRRPVRHA